jgi:hypothetical protein
MIGTYLCKNPEESASDMLQDNEYCGDVELTLMMSRSKSVMRNRSD